MPTSALAAAPDIEWLALDAIIPSPSNTRLHPPEQVAEIAALIREFGPTRPILVDENAEILAGHGARLGAIEAGLTKFPCLRLVHLSPEQKRAYRIADNKVALNSAWDTELLTVELDALREAGVNLAMIGFTDSELRALSVGVEPGALPSLPEGDRNPFRQMTFVLHDEQFAEVQDAITLARTDVTSDTGINDNAPGNALALICREWLRAREEGGACPP